MVRLPIFYGLSSHIFVKFYLPSILISITWNLYLHYLSFHLLFFLFHSLSETVSYVKSKLVHFYFSDRF